MTYQNESGKEVPYVDPVLVESTSGIGAILKLAIKYEKYETIGNDLVAQCVNEVLSYGAQPIAFLDYFACGKLIVPMVAQIIKGVADGCVKANCALLGMVSLLLIIDFVDHGAKRFRGRNCRNACSLCDR